MKILTISDKECDALWDYYTPGKLAEFDLIISCGDLKAEYLRFLVTMARCPVLYVHGNHDGHYTDDPPEGCDCIDDRVVVYNGLRILGLGGCRKYRPGPHQYTENQMLWRIFRQKSRLRRLGGVDIIVTHCPPEGLGDSEDYAHRGFHCLRGLMEEFRPGFLLHGHVHQNYGVNTPRVLDLNGTQIINAYERYVLDIPEPSFREKDRGKLLWKTPHKI